MSVYVDGLLEHGNENAPRCFRGQKSCHMYADNPDELHAMAEGIGLKRTWFQVHPIVNHYDLTPARRAAAIRRGAIPQDRAAAVRKWAAIRVGSIS